MWKTNETLKWRAWEMWIARAQKHGALSKLILNHVLQADSLNIKNAAFSTSMRTIAHAWWNVSASNSCYSHHWKFNIHIIENSTALAGNLEMCAPQFWAKQFSFGRFWFLSTLILIIFYNWNSCLRLKSSTVRLARSLSISISMYVCL